MAVAAPATAAPVQARFAVPEWARRPWPLLAVGAVLVVAVALRVGSLRNPPTDFHITRQYNGALLAHSYYADLSPHTSHADRVIASLDRPPVIEPPVLESMTVAVDLALGHETLVFPRLVSVLAWALAGVALWAIGRRLLGPLGALTAVGIFELLPFAVLATRSFQPDPLAVAAMLLAVLLSFRWAEQPTPRRFAAAATGAGLAIILKADFAPFVIAGHVAAGAMPAGRRSARAMLRPAQAVWLAAAVVPAAVWSMFVSFSKLSVAQRISTYFIAHYLVTTAYWRHLGALLSGVFGPFVLVGAAAGLLLSRGRMRALLLWSAAAFGVFAIAFDFKVATHSYYQLPFIPFVALAAACAVERVSRWVGGRGFSPVGQRCLAVAALGLAAVIVVTQDRLPSPARGREEVAAARTVGAALCHPERAVFVDAAYGMPLEYHGDMAGTAWPSPGDIAFAALHGEKEPPATAELARLRTAGSRYVIVTDEVMLQAEPDLAAALGPYPQTLSGPGYRVFDLDPAAPAHCAGGPG